MFAIVLYNVVVRAADVEEDHWFNRRGQTWVRRALVPICLLMLGATLYKPSIGLGLNAVFFVCLLIVAIIECPSKSIDISRNHSDS